MTSPDHITFDVRASMAVTNDTEVTIDARNVVVSQTGPRGGTPKSIAIPLAKWDAINGAVLRVREALETKAEALQR